MAENHDIAQLSIGAWIDRVADRFDAAWQSAAEPPALADFVGESAGGSPVNARLQLLNELIAIDREYRTKRGISKAWDAYVAEFPELIEQPATDSAVIGSTKVLRRGATEDVAIAGRAKREDEDEGEDERKRGEDHETPAAIGKYQILERLGGGGQATAYLAFDPDLSKSVVLKLSHDAPDDNELDALRTEGRVLATLQHAGLVRVLHYDLFERRPYLVMEHVEGRNLSQWAAAVHPTPTAAARLVAGIARALAAAHQRGVVHRDLKPANILVDAAGQPRVIDFGLAWHRHGWNEEGELGSTFAGTVAYMAPEQANGKGEEIGPRSDIFGLGAILYFLLTGQAPFMEKGEQDFQKVLRRARHCSFDMGLLKQKQAPPKLEAIVLKAMAAEPANRYPCAEAMAGELEAFVGSGQLRRRTVVVAAVGGAALAAIAGAIAFRERPKPVFNRELLTLRVFRNKKEMPGGVPGALISSEYAVQLRWNLPEGYVGDLYQVTPAGELSLLESVRTDEGEFVAPRPGDAFPVEGSDGTEVLLLGVRHESDPLPEIAWEHADSWPALPVDTIWRVEPPHRIEEVSGSRVSLPVTIDDPTEVVRTRVLQLARSLAGKYETFEMLVFPRREFAE